MIYPTPHNWSPGLDRLVVPCPFALHWLPNWLLSLLAIDVHLIQWLLGGGPSFSFWLSSGLPTIWSWHQGCQHQSCWHQCCRDQWCRHSYQGCWDQHGGWGCQCWFCSTLFTIILLNGLQSQPLRCQEIACSILCVRCCSKQLYTNLKAGHWNSAMNRPALWVKKIPFYLFVS